MTDARAKPHIIYLHRLAPDKPSYGASCNGCGVCCAVELCPMGRVVFLRAKGPCPALVWQPRHAQYRCGLIMRPRRFLRWLPAWAEARARQYFLRAIAHGVGCDSSTEVEAPPKGEKTPGELGAK